MTGEVRTRVEEVYRSLKRDISTGRLPPGQRVNLTQLGKTHRVSLTVVREAMIRLASERFLQATPQHGFRVWPLSVPDLLDLTRVRVEIESLTVSESIARGDLAWEADLIAAHHRLVGAPVCIEPASSSDDLGRQAAAPSFPSPVWIQAHSDFHAAVSAACTSPLLKQLRQELFDSSELYRHWSVSLVQPTKRRPGAREHRAILDAALAHDVKTVVERVANHIKGTTEALLAAHERRNEAPHA
jgi:GntR family transcriptional regulator, carbon starvation induced regulator